MMAYTDPFSDQEIIAKTAYGEARGEGQDGMCAVINVIQNRVNSPLSWWGKSFRTVCLTPRQFSCWNPSDPNRHLALAVDGADVQYQIALDLAGRAISGILPDLTEGADSYLVTGTPASWARHLTPVCVIGRHSFYKTV